MFSEKPKYAAIATLRWAKKHNNNLVPEDIYIEATGLSLEEVRQEKARKLKKFPGYKIVSESFEMEELTSVVYNILIDRPMFAEERRMLENDEN